MDRKNSRNRTAGTTEAAGIQGPSDRRSRRPKRKKPSGPRMFAGAGGFGTECPGRNVPEKHPFYCGCAAAPGFRPAGQRLFLLRGAQFA